MTASFPVVLETADDGIWVYAPDIPGCVSFGSTREEALANMREAVRGHVEELERAGLPAPRPFSVAGMVDVELP